MHTHAHMRTRARTRTRTRTHAPGVGDEGPQASRSLDARRLRGRGRQPSLRSQEQGVRLLAKKWAARCVCTHSLTLVCITDKADTNKLGARPAHARTHIQARTHPPTPTHAEMAGERRRKKRCCTRQRQLKTSSSLRGRGLSEQQPPHPRPSTKVRLSAKEGERTTEEFLDNQQMSESR